MTESLDHLRAALADRYTVERELGRGGMATVYLATDVRHKRPVALKVLKPELAAVLGPERFLREIEISARLTHINILPVHDSGEAGGFLYCVLPYVAGESLRERLDKEKQLPLDDALRIAREVADALSYAHAQGVVHRDIKPENILLEAGHAVVADFGIARAIDVAGGKRLTETGIALGTPVYMSPEQAGGDRELDGRSDLYSLGCVLYEMLAGVPPFAGATFESLLRQHLTAEPPSVRTIRPSVPVGVTGLLERALAKVPADRLDAQQFAHALAAGGLRTADVPPHTRVGWRLALGGAVLAVALVLWGIPTLNQRSPALDVNLVAVAPFDVLAPGFGMWREGLMDFFTGYLDGTGPLRVVSPSVVLRQFRGRADRAAAVALGKRLGASLVLTGGLQAAGPDSVRLTVTVVDVASDRAVGEVEVRGDTVRMDRLLDSAGVAVVRELGRVRPMGAVRAAGLPATSFTALKAYLQGEQFYRQTAWDSAMAYYQRTVEIDSTFAVAWWRMGGIRGCSRMGVMGDAVARSHVLRAAALNRGLPARETLLVSADSLFEAVNDPNDPRSAQHLAQLLTMLEDATRRYPSDPEIWFEFGDALYHFRVGTPQRALAAFDRAIALDSSFAPGYLHAIDLAATVGQPGRAQEMLSTYLALNLTNRDSEGLSLAASLFQGPWPWPAEVVRAVESASAYTRLAALLPLRRLADSTETAVRLAEAYVAAPTGTDPQFDNPAARSGVYANNLAYRGHIQAAVRVEEAAGRVWFAQQSLAQLAYLGVLSSDSVAALFGRWVLEPIPASALRQPQGWLSARLLAMPWWAENDTAGLAVMVGRLDSLALAAPEHSLDRLRGGYATQAGGAWLALARGDSADALERFMALPDTACSCTVVPERIVTAHLLAQGGQMERAAAVLERAWPWRTLDALEPLWHLERARLAERAGKRDVALAAYRVVVEVWRNADSELLPLVDEARAGVARLAGESEAPAGGPQ